LNRNWFRLPLFSAFLIALVNLVSLILIAPYAPSASAEAVLLLPLKLSSKSFLWINDIFRQYLSGEVWAIILISGVWGAGTIIGSLLSALTNRNFIIRKPRRADIVRTLIGGFLMGIGVSMAHGCNLLHTLGGTPLLVPASIIFTFFLLIGAYVCLKLMMKYVS
jgi:uncharacterized membrane protein YedE/YeeE